MLKCNKCWRNLLFRRASVVTEKEVFWIDIRSNVFTLTEVSGITHFIAKQASLHHCSYHFQLPDAFITKHFLSEIWILWKLKSTTLITKCASYAKSVDLSPTAPQSLHPSDFVVMCVMIWSHKNKLCSYMPNTRGHIWTNCIYVAYALIVHTTLHCKYKCTVYMQYTILLTNAMCCTYDVNQI